MARTNWLKRVGLVRDASLTLGTLLERLAHVQGDQVLMDEAGLEGTQLTYQQAAARVEVWAGAMTGLIELASSVRLDLSFRFMTDVVSPVVDEGLVDLLRSHVSPIGLGGGTPLLDGASRRALARREVRVSSTATHLVYDVGAA